MKIYIYQKKLKKKKNFQINTVIHSQVISKNSICVKITDYLFFCFLDYKNKYWVLLTIFDWKLKSNKTFCNIMLKKIELYTIIVGLI